MSYSGKRFVYKVYDSSGTFIASWGDVIESPEAPIQFTTTINGGPGQCQIRLARNANQFGEDDDVALGNIVTIATNYPEDSTTNVIYKGKIISYKKEIQGTIEFITIDLIGLVHELQQIIYRNGSTETSDTTVTHSSVDPGTVIFDDIMDQYIANGGNLTIGTINAVGVNRSYTFNTQTCLESMNKVLELAGNGWYWRVNADGSVDFKQVSATADHKIYMGNGIEFMSQENRMDGIINRVLFTGDAIYRVESRTTSISNYGLQEKSIIDGRVSDATTADYMMTTALDNLDSPEIRTVIRLYDKPFFDNMGYSIESFRVGDTIKIKNVAKQAYTLWDSAVWDVDKWDFAIQSITETVQPIVRISYATDYIDIETSRQLPLVQKRIEDVQRDLRLQATSGNATAPT